MRDDDTAHLTTEMASAHRLAPTCGAFYLCQVIFRQLYVIGDTP